MLLKANCSAWQSKLARTWVVSSAIPIPIPPSSLRTKGDHLRKVSRRLLVLRLLLGQEPRERDNVRVDARLLDGRRVAVPIAVAVGSHGVQSSA